MQGLYLEFCNSDMNISSSSSSCSGVHGYGMPVLYLELEAL